MLENPLILLIHTSHTEFYLAEYTLIHTQIIPCTTDPPLAELDTTLAVLVTISGRTDVDVSVPFLTIELVVVLLIVGTAAVLLIILVGAAVGVTEVGRRAEVGRIHLLTVRLKNANVN